MKIYITSYCRCLVVGFVESEAEAVNLFVEAFARELRPGDWLVASEVGCRFPGEPGSALYFVQEVADAIR